MDQRNPSTERHSFSRLLARLWHQTYHEHRLQRYRWFLRAAANFHIVPNFGKLYWHYATYHYPSVLPDLLALSLSVAARFIWHFLFRHPWGFLGFKRPGRAYRWVVGGVVGLTILPNGAVHVWALKMALKNRSIIITGIEAAVFAIILFIPVVGLVGWMAWKFLLGMDESHEEFEPVLKKTVGAYTGQRENWGASAVEPYRDDPLNHSVVKNKYLEEVYRKQRLATQEPSLNRDVTEMTGAVEARPLNEGTYDEVEREVQEPDDAENATLPMATAATEPLRCPTTARFEYMSQQHFGRHSWFLYPIFPLLLSTYATILLVVLPIFIHEDRAYDLRTPSPTLKNTLYMPLGMYLLSFYTVRHRIRASLFERFTITPPEPWREIISIVPSWIGTGGAFRNDDTGEITIYDPRRRAFPWQAYYNPAYIRTRAYIRKYNDGPHTCESYLGHSGRPAKSNFRFRPTIHRIGFLFLAGYLTVKGFFYTVDYDVPNPFNEGYEKYTPEHIARMRRLLAFWQALLYPGLCFTVMVLTLVVTLMGSTVVLFFKAVWNHMPVEKREEVDRMVQEFEELERERRIIRLE